MADDTELVITRVFDAPRTTVFRCMTHPEHLAQFWGPRGMSTPVDGITVDLRSGGRFVTTMVSDADGSRYTMSAVFSEVLAPERLAWTDANTGVETTSTFTAIAPDRTEVELGAMAGSELVGLADVLAGLTPEQWEMQSLCAGWRVREVVAHITMPTRMSSFRFLVEMAKDRGNFNRMADRIARRDAHLANEVLVAAVRSEELRRWKPPGGGARGALVHAVVHGLDVTEALGIPRTAPLRPLLEVLAQLTGPKSAKFFGTDLEGLRLEASDIDWSVGQGRMVNGPAQDLVLALSGRPSVPGRLTGDGASRFVRSCG